MYAHGRLGAQRKAENRNTGLQRKLKHSLALCKQPVVNSSVILHLQKISDDELFSSYILVQQTTYNARVYNCFSTLFVCPAIY